MAVTPKKSKTEKLKRCFLDTKSINIYAKLQVSRFNSVNAFLYWKGSNFTKKCSISFLLNLRVKEKRS